MRSTGRTPLFQQLQRSFQKARRSALGIAPLGQGGFTRRSFMTATAAGLLAMYTGRARAGKSSGPRVAVVGGGIAGLNCTNLLAKAGFNVTLYEGSNHTGGRITTDHGSVAEGVYTEIGGEFIDTIHEDMLALANTFGLDLIDTFAPSENGLQVAYYGGGKVRSEDEVIAAFKPFAKIIDRDFNKTSDDITFDSHSKFDAKLDNTTLRDYFDQNIKKDWLYEILEAAYVNEYGLNLENQSSINFVWTIGTDTTDGFAVYGESDQRYKIRGGNQQIVDALAATVRNRTKTGYKLQSLSQRASGTYALQFDGPGRNDATVEADIVVMCIPFSILRTLNVDVPMPKVKRKAIDELGYGVNAKLILGFDGRPWRDRGYTGDSYAGLPYQSGWDSSREQPTAQGAYTIYPGGDKALDLKPGSESDQAQRLLPGLNSVFPGAKKRWLGTALRAYWPSNPFIRASYSAYLPGQYTSIRGAEPMPVGNLYFAGEHTSLDWQGYMNGGAESGRLAAEAIVGVGASVAER